METKSAIIDYHKCYITISLRTCEKLQLLLYKYILLTIHAPIGIFTLKTNHIVYSRYHQDIHAPIFLMTCKLFPVSVSSDAEIAVGITAIKMVRIALITQSESVFTFVS